TSCQVRVGVGALAIELFETAEALCLSEVTKSGGACGPVIFHYHYPAGRHVLRHVATVRRSVETRR
ncbi:MAG TPA: hypothetical protein VNM48_10715, partial [Chloroflexota bacterium]|nr:hypothetical protein [Chloroflexota bacterium]